MKTIITRANIGDFVFDGTWSVIGSMSPDKDSTDKKHFTLNVKHQMVPAEGVMNKSLNGVKIDWVNGGNGRKKFDQWPDRKTHEIDFKSPGRIAVDSEEEIKAKLRAMKTKAERDAYLAELTAEFDEVDENEAE